VAIIDDGKLVEIGEVREIFRNPRSEAASKLVLPGNPFDPSGRDSRLIRLVFDGTAAGRPFIAELVEQTGKKVNILSANTKSVGGIGYGQMVLELPKGEADQELIISFFRERGLSVQEVTRRE
jgi:D-methionine transport system ATP-binding protein